MERSKAVFWIVVILASVFVIYWVGFRPPVDGPARDAPDPNAVGEPNAPADANAPADPNVLEKPVEPNEPADANAPTDPNAPADPNKPVEPNEPADPMESLNFKGVEMKNVMEKLARWTGKTIIPSDDAMKVKLTIYAPDKLPRNKALAMIYSALRMQGFIAETMDDVIFLRPIKDIKLGSVPTVPAGQPLAAIENKEQVVQKFFELNNYSPTQMSSVIQPLIGEHGHLTADENAGTLLVIDTVSNLMRLERIISQFDVPEAEQTVTRVFELKHGGDPSEIVQMLNILLGGGGSSGRQPISRYDRDRSRGGGGRYYPRPNPQPVPSSSKKGSSGGAASVVVGAGTGPIILIPEPRRNWIIARASAEDMERIAEWIERLDKEEPVQSDYEIVNLRYADPREVEDSVGDGFRDLPGTQFLPSVLIEPLPQTKQVIIFGRKDLRDIVKKMIQEIDVAPGMFETRHFPLKYADPDDIKTMIEELFSQTTSSSSPYSRFGGYYGGYSSRNRSSSPSTDEVKVISYVTLKQVTVIASPERMQEVAKQIEEWDKPLDIDSVRPRIIELKNSDPIEMADLLKKLFSEETSSRTSMFDLIFGRGSMQSQSKIVGPLYGQLTFEDVPGTKKIIVISKIPEAYDVIEQLILDLDREEMAEIPEVIEIKYADVEDLSERLNAMFVESGQQARIRLTPQGLSGSSAMVDSADSDSSNSSNAATEYTPPWSGSGARGRLDENMPISNVIGRIRFVPEPHTKSIMVLAPPEFMDEIRDLIDQLDVPGKQVMIQVIIVEVEHTKVTSLGVKFATDPAAFGALGENAMMALANITNVGTHGTAAGTTSATSGFGATGSGTVLGMGTDVYILIDFLVKNVNARILNQQSLWTKDNEEASFFKGSMVPFLEGTTLLSTGGGSTQDVTFDDVGMELRARPSITPEDKVDMVVNVNITQLTSDVINSQPVRSKMQTTTNMIIENGQTLLLGGILFQKDSLIQTKVPGLGDIPLLGGLFRHKAVIKTNSELLVFITPRVIDEKMENVSEATRAAIEGPKEKLEKILGDLDTALEGLDQ